jgi:hypothetical protein
MAPGPQSQGPISASEVQAAQMMDVGVEDSDMDEALALSGVFGMDMDMNKMLLWGGLLVGGIYLFTQMKKKR